MLQSSGRVLLILFILAPAAAEDAKYDWKPCKTREGAHPGLLDTRSLIIPHDRRLALDERFAVGGQALFFTVDPRGKPAYRTKEGGPAKALGKSPALLKLNLFGKKYGLCVRVDTEGDAVWVSSAYGVLFQVGKEQAYLVDSDLDGNLGSAGDGYVAAGCRTVGPWHANIWTRTAGLLVRARSDGKWEQAVLPVPYPSHRDHSAAWRLLQWRRQQCGVLPVGYKPELEEGIRLHGEYCVQNDYHGHDQDPAKKAYSEEGAKGGAESVLGYGIRTLVHGIEQQLATLYHRNGMLQPALTHTAMALHKGVFGANVRDSATSDLRYQLIVVPPHGLSDAPCRFNPGGETPMPVGHRKAGLAQLGTSVGAYAGPMEYSKSLPSKPTLRVMRLIGAKRKHGPSFRLDLYYPGKVPNPAVPASNFGNVGLTPPRPLDAKTTYLCRIQIPLPSGVKTSVPAGEAAWTYEWEFTTGK